MTTRGDARGAVTDHHAHTNAAGQEDQVVA